MFSTETGFIYIIKTISTKDSYKIYLGFPSNTTS